MATDDRLIIANIAKFYDFTGKSVISVGAGGGQLIDYAGPAKHVVAIDHDDTAIASLKECLKKSPLGHKYEVVKSDFYEVDVKGDVVFFEMCLHEMSDPVKALKKASSMAKVFLIFDHLPGKWAYYVGEFEKIENSWKAIRSFNVRRSQTYDGIQLFKDYTEIYEKLKGQGEPTLTRLRELEGLKDFTIPMPYAIAVI